MTETSDLVSGFVHPLPKQISVVIPTLNNIKTIDIQLVALADQDYSGMFEVLICDNGSTDGMKEYIAEHPLREMLNLRWIDAERIPGECHARNEGVDAARYDFIACCDADDRVAPGWLAALAEEATRADIVGGSLEKYSLNEPDVASWREVPDPAHLPVSGQFLRFAQGCNTAFWKTVWMRIGGFDETLVAGGGDIEFCWRAQIEGFTLGYARDAVVAYRFRPDLRSTWRQVVKYGRGEAKVVSMFRGYGARRHSVLYLLSWIAYILVWLPLFPWTWSRRRIGSWVWMAGGLYGCLSGSMKYRILYY